VFDTDGPLQTSLMSSNKGQESTIRVESPKVLKANREH
jgi:hypothetical protein